MAKALRQLLIRALADFSCKCISAVYAAIVLLTRKATMQTHEIYVGAMYRLSGLPARDVEVTEVNGNRVSYRGIYGMMAGGGPLDNFAKTATRIFPGQPTVFDVCVLMEKMAPEQRAQIIAKYS